ncbi:DUF974-domain-containing protein [Macrolepiota fuliginosa MF-IS2]|uniref:DUF974-domain-containing protein n=1 Tax=Macrolepiota fuliginosa MF-IS2 TaxID=1400762 RepID=A0A9P5XL12_9AGAR|nr:DUF974-domain-containing protein [Macrolepiota fuliginosa MF-IS2]
MAVVDSPAHLLSLKVMRVSRPEVASAWQPFFSSSPHFSAYASASILSLQGNAPLQGHPKTLRDLTHASDILTLPSSFGTIQLGQTFSSCLCTNNEAPFSVDSIRIRIEMQTVTSKTLLFQTSEPEGRTLALGDTLECIVSHEIKELGQHVLACTVTYRLPPNIRPMPGASEDPHDPGLQTFRKFYKFIVTNPLAVKTKVHPVRSPTALLTPSEREKIFLEVHIQNVTQESMHFERLSFEPTDEWQVQDSNITDDGQSVFSGSLALMNPQDVRQYIFILSPTLTSAIRPLAVHLPGSIFPLGRLNIVWRSSYGEPGRLLTSMLTRRIPLINPGPPSSTTSQPQQQHSHPASAVPPYLKRGAPVPSRPQSPTPQSRPSTPPPRRPQSPAPVPQGQIAQQLGPSVVPTLEAHLTLRDSLPSPIKVEEPFTLPFTLHISTTTQGPANRTLLFAIQHVLPLPTASTPAVPIPPRIPTINTSGGPGTGYSTPRMTLSPTSTTLSHHSQIQSLTSQITQGSDVTSPRSSLSVLSSGFSTPTATSSRGTPGNPISPGAFNYTLARQKLLVASPREENPDFYATHGEGGTGDGEGLPGEEGSVTYPPPYPLNAASASVSSTAGVVVPVGASSFTLPPLTLTPRVIPPHPPAAPSLSMSAHTSHPSTSTIDSLDSEDQEREGGNQPRLYASHDFELTYVPLRVGYYNVGGVRILDLGEGGEISGQSSGFEIQPGGRLQGDKKKAQIIKEYDIVAEILVSS